MDQKHQGIALFDSGIGGLTVLQALKKHLPHENYYYLADTLHLPYGNKVKETVESLCHTNVLHLTKYSIKALVIACNTASALAYHSLKKRFNVPLFDVITPAVEKATLHTKTKRIAILATESTIHSKAYDKAIKKRLPEAQIVSIACPLLVPLVESHLLKKALIQQILSHYLAPLKDSEVDTLILGCTHYPLLKNEILQEVGKNVQLIDSSQALADHLHQYLSHHDLCSLSKEKGQTHFFVSSGPKAFASKGKKILGEAIQSIEQFKGSYENITHDDPSL